jgi:4-hydroxythreonine-4-phosphate dehydrogenase
MQPLALTMGCPASIGPEITLRYFSTRGPGASSLVVLGDLSVLARCAKELAIPVDLHDWQPGQTLAQEALNVWSLSELGEEIHWGSPTLGSGKAMACYIEQAVSSLLDQSFSAMVTCPISKSSLNRAGYDFPGHTEMLASLTGSSGQVMMMAGTKLRVTLATIHCPLREVPTLLTSSLLEDLILTTYQSLRDDFGLQEPKLAMAALNPHGGEEGMFGDEEERILLPAIVKMQAKGIPVAGPLPPDTVFFKAAAGAFDAVICMYHDQGLIPFKLLHFKDGVNVTLGLPIIRTSVDHGTAYDIAGKGLADPASLTAAIQLAQEIAKNRNRS